VARNGKKTDGVGEDWCDRDPESRLRSEQHNGLSKWERSIPGVTHQESNVTGHPEQHTAGSIRNEHLSICTMRFWKKVRLESGGKKPSYE